MTEEFYADAYAVLFAGVPFEKCEYAGTTEHTQTEVYEIPPEYLCRFSRPSLRVVGHWEGAALFEEDT